MYHKNHKKSIDINSNNLFSDTMEPVYKQPV